MSSLFPFPIHNEVFLSAISGFDLILFLSNSYLPKRNKDLISSPHPPSSPLPSNSAFQKEGAKLNESPIGETCRKMGFPGVSKCKESACNEGGLGQSLGQKDPLEKEMTTHSSILASEIPWTEEPDGLQSVGSQKVRHNLVTKEQQQ